ncbi:lipopolysaccharide kinase InaA family protein [Bordetella sp. 02P26C-1]|uniref:lipopolysaccharide kinase InaA family protein n=1 Tax=Bordetella sp. 02P26C-1 TaxID=2683195 RepID=UPI001353E9EC|nr:lipopolysaccharide kinase InaA family protein [Bordetella sp. 02P26C-1]MVW77462.1 InaA protein [Bordetella sp. 02P26C-1]
MLIEAEARAQAQTQTSLAALPASWWEAHGDWVEDVNQRRGGYSGIQKLPDPAGDRAYFVKRQVNHVYRDLRFPSGRPTLLREWLNIHRCAKLGVPTAEPVFFDMRKGAAGWEAVLVTRELPGYISLDEGIRKGRWTQAQRLDIWSALVRALAPLHRAGRKHGHLYPKEIFVRYESVAEIALLDWEIARYVGRSRWAAQSDLGRLWRSLIELGIGEAERRVFMDRYQAASGLGQLKLRGVPD